MMIPFPRVLFPPIDSAGTEGRGIGNELDFFFSLLLAVGVIVSGLGFSRGMRIVAFTPLWSRNAWVIFSVSCV